MVEIYKGMRQNYEVPDAPRSNDEKDSIGGWRPKGFINLAFEKGYRFGFEASSDHVSTQELFRRAGGRRSARGYSGGFVQATRVRATDDILADVRSDAHVMGDAFSSSEPPELRRRSPGCTS